MSDCRLTPTQKCSVISMRGQVNFLSFSVLWIIVCLFLFFLFCFVLFCLPCFCLFLFCFTFSNSIVCPSTYGF